MKSNLIFLILAVITGALIPVQAATNAAFSKSVGNPFLTGLMVFIVGLAGMVAFILISGTAMPTTQQVVSAPLYSYLGGVIVVVYVIMISVLVRTSIAFILTGQGIFAVIIDQFGLFNVAQRPVDLTRIIGLALLIGGVYLVMKK
jgi:transporter family-2 protein